MLRSLSIRNIVLIESLEITFQPGLCALTGETGAGKSILLDALGLVLGARAESGLVRGGAEEAAVTAVFEIAPDHPALSLLKEAEIEPETPLIVRRRLGADGRSRAFVCDQPVSVGMLRQIGDMLVDIHGQNDTHGLLNPSTHGALLGGFGRLESLTGTVRDSWELWQDAIRARDTARRNSNAARAEEDHLRGALQDLDALAAQPGEEAALAEKREFLMNREQILRALDAAVRALAGEEGEEGGAEEGLSRAVSAIDRLGDRAGDAASALSARLEGALAEIRDVSAELEALAADMEEQGESLESVDERLHRLRREARKHDCLPDELPEKREALAVRLGSIESAEDHLEGLERAVTSAREAYADAARALGAARREAAARLDQAVVAELPPLRLDKARFVTCVEDLPESAWGPGGSERVRFLVAANPGSEPGPLDRIASGGETARFMLALKVAMAGIAAVPTLVFDEVDSGVGGATAAAVGERLARLAGECQVLVVTHSPQVAARAASHYIVHKGEAGDGRILTGVTALEAGDGRREEIARMLAGEEITEEARAAAQRLMETGT